MPEFDTSKEDERLAELQREEEENLIKILAAQAGYSYVDLRGLTIDPDALVLIDEETARAAKLITFEQNRQRVSVALRNPNNPEAQTVLKDLQTKGLEPSIFMTSTNSLEHGWERYHDQKQTEAVQHGVLDIDTKNVDMLVASLKTPKQVADKLLEIRSLNSTRRISETLETMLAGAIALGASDIHIEPETGGIRLRYRLDGVLHDVLDLEKSIYYRLMSRLKLLSGMILNIKNEAQDGRFSFNLSDKQIEVRSSVIPGAAGESMVMRLLDPTVSSFSMDTLGLNTRLSEVLHEELKRPNGLIITTGPTGSGKTTALYAFLRQTHKPGVKIITIENPVEYKLDNIVQTQVEDDYTFASGLRAILRQDPDIIMVGEIRDREVAETALHAAQTGHLVFSTLHTNSAVGAFPRLIDLGVDSRVMGTSINIIIGQRLVRVLCPECKKARPATETETQLIDSILAHHPQPPTNITKPYQLHDPVGCPACNQTGFSGRQAVFEAIKMDDAVEEAVIRDPREHIILEAAKPQKIPNMAQDGIVHVLNGTTSLTELQRVVDLSTGKSETVPDPTKPTEDDFASHIV